MHVCVSTYVYASSTFFFLIISSSASNALGICARAVSSLHLHPVRVVLATALHAGTFVSTWPLSLVPSATVLPCLHRWPVSAAAISHSAWGTVPWPEADRKSWRKERIGSMHMPKCEKAFHLAWAQDRRALVFASSIICCMFAWARCWLPRPHVDYFPCCRAAPVFSCNEQLMKIFIFLTSGRVFILFLSVGAYQHISKNMFHVCAYEYKNKALINLSMCTCIQYCCCCILSQTSCCDSWQCTVQLINVGKSCN